MVLSLPKKGRPLGIYYKKCDLGLDLPAQFMNDLWGIDDNFYPIFHPYRILWDDLVNEYVGSIDDPRYSISENSFKVGELVMGHVLSNGQDIPTPDGHWHIWRWIGSVGAWAHIIKIESRDPTYLHLLVQKLWLQAYYYDKFGYKGFTKVLEEADFKQREKLIKEKHDLMYEISKTNSAMMNRIMDNFASGKVKPTNPQKEIIMSGGGIKRKDKIVRPLTDKEGGFVVPEEI